jgi:GDP-6-deoxy-D-talose 4-dehydrogenase
MFREGRRVLVTGVDGFTGQYLKREFESAGWSVFGMGRADCSGEPNYKKLDLADTQGLTDYVQQVSPHAVVHLAAISFVVHGNADDFYRVNLLGTRNLLTALAKSAKRPNCVVLASSANVYGNTAHGMISEGAVPNPANDYAVSKLAMEYMAKLWADQLPIVITRPFNYTGVGQSESFLLPKIVAHLKRGATQIELGNLDVSREFSDVRTVAKIYLKLVEAAPVGQVVNICSGQAFSLSEVLELAQKLAGREIQVKTNPAFVRENEVKTLLGDPTKLHSVIGDWEKIPLEKTIAWMLEE